MTILRINNRPIRISSPISWGVARGSIPGVYAIRKFGRSSNVAASLEDIWDGSNVYVYLTSPEQLKVSSGDVNDSGSLVTSGTVTEGSKTQLIDSNATFQTDGVAPGDVVINDTVPKHAIVLTVDSETQITFATEHENSSNVGDSYRIATASSTGAAAVQLVGLDENWDVQVEYIILNGTTTVTTVGSFIRVYRSMVIIAGSTGANEGLILTKNTAEDNTLAQISLGFNQTLMALWTVPRNFESYMQSFYGATALDKATEIHLYVRPFGEVFQIKKIVSVAAGSERIIYDFPLPIPEKADVAIRGIASGGGGEISAGFDLWLEERDFS